MNPACKLNLDGKECQVWMDEVCAHCAQLLPSVEDADLWDKWWADELPAPFKPRVNLMSAYDCHKLRKEVARQVSLHGDKQWYEDGGNPASWTVCTLILLIIVIFCSVIALICALKILFDGVRRWSVRVKCRPTKVVKAEKQVSPKPPTPPPCKPKKEPKSFISFGRNTDPRTRFGPYKHQKLLKIASTKECNLVETISAKSKSSPRVAQEKDQHVQRQSKKNKSATK
ncbi:LOW QUALITY PROTEIN: uncharacterized protein LOC108111748 [Drosophila eugracilis]|uniref:LOW QUALITY PROTEIN: uncharacterized protein LOC108111748 n=1 Tax=Drosophila eugracilis TaxID=29029 RepID=UPI001BDB59E2|nr:LOW QUALITY PROTEIN: uncharacterized protein LOC108111748 [Drosophila eugracilis]